MIRRANGVVEADIDGEKVILAPTTMQYLGLNGAGAGIWDRLSPDWKTQDSLIAELLKVYDVDHERCSREVDAFVRAGIRANIIEECDD